MDFDDDNSDVLPRPSSVRWYTEAWRKAVQYWDADQKGWYHELLMWSATDGEPPGYLPADEEHLKKIAGYEDPNKTEFGLVALSISSLALETYARRQEAKWAKVRKKFRTCKDNESLVYNPKMLEVVEQALAAQRRRTSSQTLANKQDSNLSLSNSSSSVKSSYPVSSKALPVPQHTKRIENSEKQEILLDSVSKEDTGFSEKSVILTNKDTSKHPKDLETNGIRAVASPTEVSTEAAAGKSIVQATWEDDLSLPSRALPSQSRLYDFENKFITVETSSQDSSSGRKSNLSNPFNSLSSPDESKHKQRPTLEELEKQVEEEKQRKKLQAKLIRTRKSREPTLFDESKFFLDEGLVRWLKERHPDLEEDDWEFLREQFCNARCGRIELSWRRQFHTYVNNALAEWYQPGRVKKLKLQTGTGVRNNGKYESAAERNQRLEHEQEDYLAKLRSAGSRDPDQNPSALRLTTQDINRTG